MLFVHNGRLSGLNVSRFARRCVRSVRGIASSGARSGNAGAIHAVFSSCDPISLMSCEVQAFHPPLDVTRERAGPAPPLFSSTRVEQAGSESSGTHTRNRLSANQRLCNTLTLCPLWDILVGQFVPFKAR